MTPSYHLQSKPKLLVILGAGSSIPCGMPPVGKIDELMKRWSQEWAPQPSVNIKGDVVRHPLGIVSALLWI